MCYKMLSSLSLRKLFCKILLSLILQKIFYKMLSSLILMDDILQNVVEIDFTETIS